MRRRQKLYKPKRIKIGIQEADGQYDLLTREKNGGIAEGDGLIRGITEILHAFRAKLSIRGFKLENRIAKRGGGKIYRKPLPFKNEGLRDELPLLLTGVTRNESVSSNGVAAKAKASAVFFTLVT